METPHELLFWRADHIHTVIKGEYKLIYSSRDKWTELYHLKSDVGEKNNLYLLLPEKVKELNAELEWKKKKEKAKNEQIVCLKKEKGPRRPNESKQETPTGTIIFPYVGIL